MAISYVIGTTGSNSGGGQVTVNVPAGVQNGDLMVATIITDGNAFPAAWTVQKSGLTPTQLHAVTVATRVASNEPASYNFGSAGGTFIDVIWDVYRGVDTTTPMDAAAAVATGTAANATFPNITTVTDGAVHYASFCDDAGLAAPSPPTSYTARSGVADNVGIAQDRAYDRTISPAGLVSGVATTGGALSDWVALSVALRPASAAAPSLVPPGALKPAVPPIIQFGAAMRKLSPLPAASFLFPAKNVPGIPRALMIRRERGRFSTLRNMAQPQPQAFVFPVQNVPTLPPTPKAMRLLQFRGGPRLAWPPTQVPVPGAAVATTMAAAAGTYVVTGFDVKLDVGLGSGAGSYVVTGAPTTLAVLEQSSAGAYVLTGFAVTLAVNIGDGVGTYVVSGADAALGVNLQGAAGAYTISGAPALMDVALGGAAGAYLISGAAAALVTGAPSANAGSYVVTGAPVAMPINRSAAQGLGAYSVTGNAVSMPVNRKPSLGYGVYTVTGYGTVGPSAQTKPEWLIRARRRGRR